jgi:D-glycero-alpha-D-manno-heptose-7-phosphate kinase
MILKSDVSTHVWRGFGNQCKPTSVRSRAPLRLGFSGGGTDLSPFCDIYGGQVLNATVTLYAYTTISLRDDNMICFAASDRHRCQMVEARVNVEGQDDALILHAGVYRRIMRQFNNSQPMALNVTTYSDVMPGSGLGSSSTMVVSIVKAFAELLTLPLGEYDIAHLAYEIERVDLGLLGGRQDQYAATFGGFNFMEFYKNDRVIVNPLRIKNWIISELECSLVLYYTGQSRSSARIIEKQVGNIEAADQQCMSALHELKAEAVGMKEALLRGDLRAFAAYMAKGWESKKRTAGAITNDHIENVYVRAAKAGALAGKLSGAGGGGFMMFLVDPMRRMEVIEALQDVRDGEVVPVRFQKHGTEGWRA